MRNQTLWIVIVGVLVVASALFVVWAALQPLETAPPPPATNTPLPPSPVSTSPTPTRSAWQEGSALLDLDWVTLSMPTGWRYVVKEWAADPPSTVRGAVPLLMAWRDAATFADSRLRFTLIAVPRNGLSLERYLDDVRSQLLEDAYVSDVVARIATDLRADGLPVALISYRTGTQMGQTQIGQMVGYQVAALDATGEQLLIATLVQPEDDEMQLLRSFIAAMRFVE